MKQFLSSIAIIACTLTVSPTSASAAELNNTATVNECETHSSNPTIHGEYGRPVSPDQLVLLDNGLSYGAIPHITPRDEILLDKAVAITDGTNGMVYRIPLYDEFSDTNYLLVQTSNGEVQRVAETHIDVLSQDEARLQVWIDGHQEYDSVVRESDGSYSTRGVRDAWSTFNSCLSNAGVPMAVVTAISLACGLLGAFTAGTGVPACMIGAAGAFAATVSFCYGRALKVL